MKVRVLIPFLLLCLGSVPGFAYGEMPTGKQMDALKRVIGASIESMNNEDLSAYLAGIDSESPIYQHREIVMGQLFAVYDLQTTSVSVLPLMVDDEFFIVRHKVRKLKLSGRAQFRNVLADMVQVYRIRQGEWRLWSSLTLKSIKI